MSTLGLKNMSICFVEDCTFNQDCVCSKELIAGSEQCNNTKEIETLKLKKEYERVFSPECCKSIALCTITKGSQQKWLTNDGQYLLKGLLHYQERYWNDDIVEVIAAGIGKQLGIFCLEQHLGRMGNFDCSYSKNWGEKKFIPFTRLDPQSKIREYLTTEDKIQYALDTIYEKTHLDYKEYFMEMCTLDWIIGNEDRHENNFGVWYNGNTYEKAILFDFGLGLFEHDICYKGLALAEAKKKMQMLPFGHWSKAIEYLSKLTAVPTGSVVVKYLMPNELARDYIVEVLGHLGIEVIDNESL